MGRTATGNRRKPLIPASIVRTAVQTNYAAVPMAERDVEQLPAPTPETPESAHDELREDELDFDRQGDVEPTDDEGPRPTWTKVDWWGLAFVTIAAGALRLVRLAVPPALVFDETYYARDACWYVNASASLCDIDAEQTPVHPPLAKWVIAIGIRIFGHNSFGWRIAAVVAGTVSVALLYLLARKLLHSTLGAVVASGLLAFDFLHFVQSRVAMLDIFITVFALAAVLFAVYDRDRLVKARDYGIEPPPGLLDRPWRLAAGCAAGAAIASKWSGGLVLGAIILLTIVWEIAARREDGRGHVLRRLVDEEMFSIITWLVILPMLIYALTYIGRIDGAWAANPLSEGAWTSKVWNQQVSMFHFHRTLDANHSYQSPAWSWILLKRPVSYFIDYTKTGDYREIIALGNPFVWAASLLAIVVATVAWLRRREWRGPEGVIVAGFFLTYGPWLLLSKDRGSVFLFYLLPTVPFMCLALGYVATRIGDTWESKAAIAVFSAGTVGLFAFYYPVLAAAAIPKSEWQRRIWIFDDCDKPSPIKTTSTVTETHNGKTSTSLVTNSAEQEGPPEGWCWI